LFFSFCNRTHIQSTLSTKEQIDKKLPKLFQNHILCAGTATSKQGSCKGDSGGPLMYLDSEIDRWIQIATVHGGIRDCGDIDFPGLYIRLDAPDVFNFIKSIIHPNITGYF
jgi:secreted trypsin-like serine protease